MTKRNDKLRRLRRVFEQSCLDETEAGKILESRFLPVALREKQLHTVKEYRRCIRRFGEYLGRPVILSDLTEETIAGFLAWYEARSTSARTAHSAIRRLRRFWKWCAAKGLCAKGGAR